MLKALTVLSFALCMLHANAGAIVISTSDNVNLTVPPVAGSLANYSGSACVGIPATASNCVSAVPPSTLQPSSSITTSSGSAQASATGPTDLSQPLVLTADGEINASSTATEGSSYSFSVGPSAPVTNYYLFPSISLNFAPSGFIGSASVTAFQDTESDLPIAVSDLLLQMGMDGTSFGDFTLDPSANVISLIVLPGDSGYIYLTTLSFSPLINQTTTLIDFEFQNGLVTVSNNTLGLALPPVGSSADFLLTAVSPFQASLAPIDYSPIKEFDEISQSASLAAPEPNTAWLLLAGIAAIVVTRARGRKIA